MEQYQIDLLARAQRAYGYSNQVMVTIEELCELSSVLLTTNAQRSDIVEETADVNICLHHIYMMFDISFTEIKNKVPSTTSVPLSVCAKGLCDLACLLTKYPRFKDHESATVAMREKVVQYLANTVSLMHHLLDLYNIKPEELARQREKKLKRLERWLNTSDSFEQTTIDREVK